MDSEGNEPVPSSSLFTSRPLPNALRFPLGNASAVTHRLPAFSLPRFTSQIRTAQLCAIELKDNARKERAFKTAFWVTPGLRPLAEPPGVDWKWFSKKWIHSDLRHRKLFPHDPRKRCDMKDLDGEQGALFEYWQWTISMADESAVEGNTEREAFYDALAEELEKDHNEVVEEWEDLKGRASVLGYFEYKNLDNNGKTEGLERKLAAGEVIADEEDPDVRRVYGELLDKYPLEERKFREFEKMYLEEGDDTSKIEMYLNVGETLYGEGHPQVQEKYAYLFQKPGNSLLERFERRYGCADGDTTELEVQCLKDGYDPFLEYGPEVQAKYEDLRSKYEVEMFEYRYLPGNDPENEMRWMQHLIWTDDDADFKRLFVGRAREKYAHMVPTPLELFENYYIEDDGSTTNLEKELAEGCYMLHELDEKVQEKYGALFAKYSHLYRFEKSFVAQENTSTIERWPRKKWESVLGYFNDAAVVAKYGHLIPPEPLSKDAEKSNR